MTFDQEYDGPRLIRPQERAASDRLFHLCFGHSFEDIEEVNKKESAPPLEIYVIIEREVVSQIAVFHEQLELPGGFIRIGSIGGVCTHPQARGHGLASRLLDHCAQQLLRSGARLMLISGERGLYTRAGCARAGKYASFALKPGLLASPGIKIYLRPPGPADADLCYRLYQSETVRFDRPPETFSNHLSQPSGGFFAEEWIVEVKGQPVAYLLFRLPWEDIGHPERGIRILHEYAGDRLAVVGGLAQAFERAGLRKIQFPVPWQDTKLIDLLKDSHGTPDWIPLPEHTMRILDFAGMMADLEPYIKARLDTELRSRLRFTQTGPLLEGNEADLCSISLESERLELDGAAMARLVMGSASDIPPGEISLSEGIQEVISALFPLSSFLPGLDYH